MIIAALQPGADPKAIRQWKRRRVQAFKLMAPAALSFVASECNVSVTLWDGSDVKRRFGHNRAARAAKFIKGTSLEDNAAKNHKTGFFKYKTFFSIWTRRALERNALAEEAIGMLELASERDGGMEALDDGFSDMGPDLNIASWEQSIRALAADRNIVTWSNAELISFLDRVLVRTDELTKGWKGGRYSPLEVALSKELEA